MEKIPADPYLHEPYSQTADSGRTVAIEAKQAMAWLKKS